MKALKEIGLKKTLKFFFYTLAYLLFRSLVFPPLRTLFLKIFGAKIGCGTVIHSIKFINYYRGCFGDIKIGNDCFLGNDVLLDLAAPISLGNQVTLSERTMVLTHLNVGYKDHPLQKFFPSRANSVKIGSGSFVGAGSIILDGVEIGENCFVGAASLVNRSVSANSLVAGVPAKLVKTLEKI